MDPETPLKKGLNPTPDYELDFWRAKAAHLNAIFAQLTKPAWKATSAISTAQRTQNNCGHMKRLKAAFSNFPCSEEATKVGTNVGQNGGVFPPSP